MHQKPKPAAQTLALQKSCYHLPCPFGKLVVWRHEDEASPWNLELWQENTLIRSLLKKQLPPYQLKIFINIERERDHFFKTAAEIFYPLLEQTARILDRQDQVLRFGLHGGRYALQSLVSSPCYFLLMALLAQEMTSPETYCREVSRLLTSSRHSVVAEFFAMPPKKWLVKLLDKVHGNQISCLLLRRLRYLLHDEDERTIKLLKHSRCIDLPFLDLLADKSIMAIVGNRLALTLADLKTMPEKQRYLTNISEVVRIQRFGTHRFNMLMNDLEDIERQHSRAIFQLNSLEGNHLFADLKFASPPFSSKTVQMGAQSFSLTPLTNQYQLWNEGRRMLHCIASYGYEVYNNRGSIYAYHVTFADNSEVTILISKDEGDIYRIREARGKENEPLRKWQVHQLDSWLRQQQKAKIKALENGENVSQDNIESS